MWRKDGCKGCYYDETDKNIINAFLLANKIEIITQEEFENVKRAIENILKELEKVCDENSSMLAHIRKQYVHKSKIKNKLSLIKQYRSDLLKKNFYEEQQAYRHTNILFNTTFRDIKSVGKIEVLQELLGEKED